MLLNLFYALLFLLQGVFGMEADAWFYAQDLDTNEVVAYNLAGETSSLGTNFGNLDGGTHIRIDAQTVFAGFIDEQRRTQYYLLTPEGSAPVGTPVDELIIPADYHYPYLAMEPIQMRFEDNYVVLFDLDAMANIRLDIPVSGAVERFACCRFAEDGNTLYYVHQATIGDRPLEGEYQLRARDLTAGEETTFYEITADGEAINNVRFWSSGSGERWLVQLVEAQDEDTNRTTTLLVSVDGTIEEIDRFTDFQDFQFYEWFDELIAVWSPHCEADCTLELRDPATGTSETYRVTDELFSPTFMYRTEMGDLIITTDEQFFQISKESRPRLLGHYRRPTFADLPVSPDGRWIVSADRDTAPSELGIYDAEAGEVVQRISVDEGVHTFTTIFLPDYVVINDVLDSETFDFEVYNITSDSMTTVTFDERRAIFEVVGDTRLILGTQNREGLQITGYNLETGEETILLNSRYMPINTRSLDE
jgi:hypothetical protein